MESIDYRLNNDEERIKAHGEQLDDIEKCLVKLTALQESITSRQEDHEQRLREMEGHAGNMWDKLMSAALGAVVSGVIVYALMAVGLQ